MLGMAAVGADVHGHVLHHAQHRDVDLAEHFHALARVQQRQVLGVVTITAPATGTFCARVSWMSPVPGGMSITR
jgi:membrane glycosyltransferase